MSKVLIIGGGFAGASVAKELERSTSRTELDVTLLNRENYMLFTPMLPEVATGSIESRHVVQPLRVALRKTTFELGDASAVDLAKRTVSVTHPLVKQSKTLKYDHLVLAMGSHISMHGIAGAQEHSLPLRTVADAASLRDHVIGVLEVAAVTKDLAARDRLLRFVIVGGGFNGVEVAGELRGFLRDVMRFYPQIKPENASVVIINEGERLLKELPPKFGKAAAQSLFERNIEIRLQQQVDGIDAEGVALKNGTRLESRTVIWSTGDAPSPLIKQLDLRTSKHGAIVVGSDFSVPGHPGVWALGDCASVPKEDGGFYPPLAQNAVREGPRLARNLMNVLSGKPTKPFAYRVLGMMASLGDRQGLVELPGGRMLTGTPAWLLWRTYYLSRLPGLYRKVRVAADWTLEMFFPRDISSLGSSPGARYDGEMDALTA
ncbi:MAG: NAD(P)/FAD-dependent oxidoreductase [Candidatus Eremiobacteraeota bacterium]|nr:NAD(P)/FAD-dependent oxidoreductase [Candidatus Eremiobacteraeota bacterium]